MPDNSTIRTDSDDNIIIELASGETVIVKPSDIAFEQDLSPETDGEEELGSPSKSWGALYADEVAVAGGKIGRTIDGQIPVSQIVAAGETLEIPAGYGQFVAGPLTVNGSVELDGTLTVAPGPIVGEGSISGTGRIHIP